MPDVQEPTPVRVKVVPRRFIHLVAFLEQMLDLKSVGFDVVGRLKAYEEGIRGEDGGDEERVMFTHGGGSSKGGRNAGGGGGGSGGDFSGASGSLSRRMKGKMRSINRCEVNNEEGFCGGSTGDGRNTGGGSDGVSGFLSREKKEVKQKWGRKSEGVNNRDGSGGSSGSGSSKAQSIIKPNKSKPNNQPISIPTQTENIGSNQVQGNAELDWNQRHL